MPRQTFLTDDLVRQICGAIALYGSTLEEIAAAESIGRSTIMSWLARGHAPGPGDHTYVDLALGVERARAFYKLSLKQQVVKHSKNDPRTAVYLLEREEAAEKHRSDGRPQEITIRIERKDPLGVFRDGADDGAGGVETTARAGDPVDAGGGVVEPGLDERERIGDNVVVIRRKTVA